MRREQVADTTTKTGKTRDETVMKQHVIHGSVLRAFRVPGTGSNISYVVFFAASAAYFLSITLLQKTPWFPEGPGFTFAMSLVWAFVPLVLGLIINTPASIASGFLFAALGPYHKTAIIAAFILGMLMLARVLVQNRADIRGFLRYSVKEKHFGLVAAILGYLVLNQLLHLDRSTDGWSSLALGASLLTVPLAAYSLSYLQWTRKDVKKLIAYGAMILGGLALAVLLYPAITGQWIQYPHAVFVFYKALATFMTPPFKMIWIDPDFNMGSLRSSHFMAAIMLLGAVASFSYGARKRSARFFLAGILGVYLFALGENTHILAGVVTGVMVLGLLRFGKRLSGNILAALILGMVVIVTLATATWFYRADGPNGKTPKGRLYQMTLDYIESDASVLVLGEGPAAFSSHAARKRLPRLLTDENRYPLLPAFVNPAYRVILEDTFVKGTSSTMNRQMSGLLGLVMEWGVLGGAILMFALFTVIKKAIDVYRHARNREIKAVAAAALFGLAMVFVSLVFRPYFEYPDVMSVLALMFLVTGIARSSHLAGDVSRLEDQAAC